MIPRLFLGAVVSLALIAIIGRVGHLRIILTDSAAPLGIYRTVTARFTRGELVLACLPSQTARLALERGYLGAGDCQARAEPVAKIIGALPGDTLEIQAGWTAVNGVRIPNSSTVPRDSMGRSLAHVAWGMRTVPSGQVWLFGFNNRRSWDGRYFGQVPIRNVLGELEPLITW
jgi:conjugative transfer signal peptidase TraF